MSPAKLDNFHDWDDTHQSGVIYQNSARRAAAFVKGTLIQDYVVTGSYDSQKINREKFFSDINPNDYYPIYGDTSVVHYDARSTSKLYARVDQGKNYFMFGDYLSHEASSPMRLGSYSRTLNGIRAHYDHGSVAGTAFAAKTSRTTMVDEQPGLGLSGPYAVSRLNALTNSEQINIVVRDRYQPALVVSSKPMTRHVDYEFEPFSGRILFREPVPSIDENLNPVSIRVSYEVEGGGPKYWVAGVDGEVTLAPGMVVSGRYAKDENPLTDKTLAGATAEWKVGEGTRLMLDLAHSSGSEFLSNGAFTTQPTYLAGRGGGAQGSPSLLPENPSGNAYRAEVSHQSE